jgi:hypothetical protein
MYRISVHAACLRVTCNTCVSASVPHNLYTAVITLITLVLAMNMKCAVQCTELMHAHLFSIDTGWTVSIRRYSASEQRLAQHTAALRCWQRS